MRKLSVLIFNDLKNILLNEKKKALGHYTTKKGKEYILVFLRICKRKHWENTQIKNGSNYIGSW